MKASRANRFAALFAGLILLGCAGTPRLRVVTPATPEQNLGLFEQVKALEGTWVMADEGAQGRIAAIFSVSSRGSIVREVMFPGAEHEMTNVYHMDGPSLVLTHYCAGGNQPRMRAATAEAGTIVFAFDSITNLTAADDHYMGEMTLVRVDENTLREEWRSFQDGRLLPDHSPAFTLSRRR